MRLRRCGREVVSSGSETFVVSWPAESPVVGRIDAMFFERRAQ